MKNRSSYWKHTHEQITDEHGKRMMKTKFSPHNEMRERIVPKKMRERR